MFRARPSECVTWIFLAVLISMPASAALGAADTLADFEGPSVPPEFFTFAGGSTVATTPLNIDAGDPVAKPGQTGTNGVLQVDYNVFDFGGFGQSFQVAGPQDWSNYTSFDFWFYGTGSGLTYQAEISDNRSDPNLDTSERFDYQFTDTTPGWRYISIPFEDFTRATDFQPGGAPDDGFTLTEVWAWAIVLPNGTDIVYFDDVALGLRVIDDFETGLPSGVDANGIPIGFYTFSDGSPISIATTTTPPAPVPGSASGNNVLAMTGNVGAFAGFIHGFENAAVDTWTPQDWSAYEGLRIWVYGLNTGTTLFVDVLDNRNPGSTSDDAERYTVSFVDDFSGWQLLEFPFSSFVRKEIGNGAPNDGFTLNEVHGWALGMLNTPGEVTFFVDDAVLYGVAEIPELEVTFSDGGYVVDEGATGTVAVKLNRPMTADDPAQVSIDFATEVPGSSATANRDYTPVSGTLTFVNGGPSELSFQIETLDDTKFEGLERIALRLSNPVDVEPGFITQASGFILDNDPFDPNLLDDFEQGAYLWDADSGLLLDTPELFSGDALARPGQDTYEHILDVSTPIAVDIVIAGSLCNSGNGVVPVVILTTDSFDATSVDHTTVRFGDAQEAHSNKKGLTRHEEDFDGDGDIDLVFHFRVGETGYDCGTTETTLTGTTFDGQPIGAGGNLAFGRDFAIGQDWSSSEALRFWYYGTGSGDEIGVTLKDNRAPDPGPAGWSLAWSDEFNETAGTPPNPANWGFEISDVDGFGNAGWGNQELQYYTDDPANAATDGNGNLVITLREADGTLECYYGTCEYTSARLITKNRAEFAYGRIESRLLVPDGSDGLWPAFWSLGTDIARNPWPGAGEIDFMEYVSRIPNEIFGTIHGPGYSGGASFGDIYDFGQPVSNDYHTFAVEWEPNSITWYVDGIQYHQAAPSDVPGPWVFNKPFYLLLNMAIGGNFGGAIDPALELPQEYKVDYVRVYQAGDTAERFEASFVDNFIGWQEVVIPFTVFTRSAEQPDGAPNDGLGLSEVWGYGFTLPDGGTTQGSLRIDLVRLQPTPPPTAITVTNSNDSGDGSLRQALEDIAIGGTISMDPSLAGSTILLTSGPLVPAGDVTIDASAAPGLSIDGGAADRVLIVDAGLTVNLSQLTIANGYGFQLAGCVLNNGDLSLDHVTVTGCLMTTNAGDFWQGGGGIYNGAGASLILVDSSVSNNTAGWSGGGVYSFFNTATTIIRSTIGGNLSNDVGGGLRLLGNAYIENSTISSNQSTGWYGGALFLTDGILEMVNSTVVDNLSPSFAPAAVFVGTFGDSSATLNLVNSIVARNLTEGCFLAPFGPGPVAINSLGNNVFTDATCNPAASDQVVADPLVGPLQDNGGPTLTHGLQPGSPAIDTANPVYCPPTDQRGVARDAACDSGAFEFVP
jgi:beta-glucanase (GH16 family)